MKQSFTFRKLLPPTIESLILAIFGYYLVFFGVLQAHVYFSGIKASTDGSVYPVPADSSMAKVQIIIVIIILLIIFGLYKFNRTWFKALAGGMFVAIFLLETGMAIGYTGL